MIRLLIVDDHDVVRMGLKQVFSGRVDMEVAGEARTGEEAIAQVRPHPMTWHSWTCRYPTCRESTSSTVQRRSGPEMAVLIVSGYPEDQYAINLLKAGASGLRREGMRRARTSSRRSSPPRRDAVMWSPRIADKLAQGLAGPAADQAVAHAALGA